MTRRRMRADLAVIGAGSGGLSVAAGAAQLGLKVVLFEKGEMGGDCLNWGCVPSKALIAAADAAAAARSAERLGVRAEPQVDFPAVMAHVRRAIETIAPHDSQARFEGLGVTVVREAARFTGPRTVESDSVCVTARKVVIAAGSHPRLPALPGLESVAYLTNETIFSLHELPARLLVLGAGPIGLELGQAFRRLGSEVVVVEHGAPLPREDRDLVEPLLEQLRLDGVERLSGARAVEVDHAPSGVALTVEVGGERRRLEGTHLLVAVGRKPALEGLGLEAAGVAYDAHGVHTDSMLRSVSNRAVFAVGDAAGRQLFTHVAGAHAGLVVRKALFAQSVDVERLVVPRVTYTDPEVAVVGLTEAQARAAYGDRVRVLTAPFSGVDRAVAEGDVRGFGKLVLDPRGKVLGAALVGRSAGELIHPWALALDAKLPLRAFTSFIAPYPTRGEIHKRLASAFYSPILFSGRTRALVSLLKRFG
ncbi:FAD-dependent oxidoreductase [Caulobacter sp. 17J65-9]|uniref:dihydrolipoyl dehydrogenase family protein n=1 Tax=Caulobacter sp. 17J65-9 TaxID=2709382 RepID=UPI0013CBEFF8|nr:FAD-dependent oxidoreductase [Caulobacter sp. 17J65-9]NEX95093.1 FAD-dependent oxidoreductase [Caulobacter sp. 17J65-9]